MTTRPKRSSLRRSLGSSQPMPSSSKLTYEYALRCAIFASQEEWRQRQSTLTNEVPNGIPSFRRDPFSPPISAEEGWSGLSSTSGSKSADFRKEPENSPTSNEVSREFLLALREKSAYIMASLENVKGEKEFQCSLQHFQNDVFPILEANPSVTVEELMAGFAKCCTEGEGCARPLQLFTKFVKEVGIKSATMSQETARQLENFMQEHGRVPEGDNENELSGDSMADMPLVRHVGRLFEVDLAHFSKRVIELQSICTEQNALEDIKRLLDCFHRKSPYLSRTDFLSDEAFAIWMEREKQQLNGLLNVLAQQSCTSIRSPTQVLPATLLSREHLPADDPDSCLKRDHVDHKTSEFTFIPPDPKLCLRILLTVCFNHECSPTKLASAQRRILLPHSETLLKECVVRWRLPPTYRHLLLLDLITSRIPDSGRYQKSMVSHAKDQLDTLMRVQKEYEFSLWTVNERELMLHILEALSRVVIELFAKEMEGYYNAWNEWVRELEELLEKVRNHSIYRDGHSNGAGKDMEIKDILAERLEGAAITRYHHISTDIEQEHGEVSEIGKMVTLAYKLLVEYKVLNRRFPRAILQGQLNVLGIVLRKQMAYFVLQLECVQMAGADKAFDLYRSVVQLMKLYSAFCPEEAVAFKFRLESHFLTTIHRYLQECESCILEWVQNALQQDTFHPLRDEGAQCSSSIVDIFISIHQAVDFIQQLEWPDPAKNAEFQTQLARIACRAMEQYCVLMEYLFSQDIQMGNPESILDHQEGAVPAVEAKSWVFRAKSWVHPPHAHTQPLHLTQQMCVKLNDIEIARRRLDELYQLMGVDSIARANSLQMRIKREQSQLCVLKIVKGEGLGKGLLSVVLEHEGRVIARTLARSGPNPVWNQVFEMPLEEEAEILLTVVEKERWVGEARVKLMSDPPTWITLLNSKSKRESVGFVGTGGEGQGRVQLRIHFESREYDIQSWFAKAFRVLTRTEGVMVAAIVEQFSPAIHDSLSRSAISGVLAPARRLSWPNLANQALHGLSSMTTLVTTRAPLHPPSSGNQSSISAFDCEQALDPLLEYLERNLKMLCDTLPSRVMNVVLLRVWKEILNAVVEMLLPPLEGATMRPLSEMEGFVVFKWVELLKIYFNGGEEGNAIPLDQLESQKYRDILQLWQLYDAPIEELQSERRGERMRSRRRVPLELVLRLLKMRLDNGEERAGEILAHLRGEMKRGKEGPRAQSPMQDES
ncbi:uncharacterized protein VTP21DRAFT_6339 [Calcarisporiella thermophila]|uniref:uncharacterized protein n=1 Tax=Calcarisporiella thermophila TaxID=911321 RepID=UPI0037443A87